MLALLRTELATLRAHPGVALILVLIAGLFLVH